MAVDLFPHDTGAPPPLLSAAECREQCRVNGEDEDTQLLAYAAAAQAWVENYTGRRLTPRPARAVTEGWASWRIVGGPVPTITAIRYLDTEGQAQVVPAADYVVGERLDLATVRLRAMVVPPPLPEGGSISIDMTIGYGLGEAPPDLRAACLLLLGHYYRNREAVVTGATPTELPMAVESLCIRHRIMVLP